jgi:hypothetical protein
MIKTIKETAINTFEKENWKVSDALFPNIKLNTSGDKWYLNWLKIIASSFKTNIKKILKAEKMTFETLRALVIQKINKLSNKGTKVSKPKCPIVFNKK